MLAVKVNKSVILSLEHFRTERTPEVSSVEVPDFDVVRSSFERRTLFVADGAEELARFPPFADQLSNLRLEFFWSEIYNE